MNKFKVGDKVRLKDSITSVYLDNNTAYTVEEAFYKKLRVQGVDFKYNEDTFDLVSSEVNDSSDFLSPLEAAEAMLKDKDIEFLSEVSGEWRSVGIPYSQQCLKTLSKHKLRLKPKTVVINGVEVVAPAKKDDIEQYFYTVNFSENIVHTIDKIYINNNFKHYWATEEDAQKALDAMLIPFEQ